MVANAGRFQPLTPFLESKLLPLIANFQFQSALIETSFLPVASLEKFDGVYALNARGVFACFKYAALQMVKQGRGGRLLGPSFVILGMLRVKMMIAMRSGTAACSDAGKRGMML